MPGVVSRAVPAHFFAEHRHKQDRSVGLLAESRQRGTDLHDSTRRDVGVGRLEVERHVTRQPRVELAGMHELEALEERQPVHVS